MTVEVWKLGEGRREARERASTVSRRIRFLGRWAGGKGRNVWGLGVGQHRLSTVSVFRSIGGVRRTLQQTQAKTLQKDSFHLPVMRDEVVRLLAPTANAVYLDGTVGGGGHAEAILRAAGGAQLLAVDRDPEALEAARVRLAPFGTRVRYREGDFADSRALFGLGEGALAGVLLDLGVSSHQIDSSRRGFSFRAGAPLDMRMSGHADEQSAAQLLASLSTAELEQIFRRYGEERRARRLAQEIVKQRQRTALRMSDDLLRVIQSVWSRPVAPSDLARLFQALRIAVNHELESLERALPELRDLLVPGGRMVVLSYHSLEDRLVKRAFREWSRECVCPPELPECRCRGRSLGRELTRGPLRPSEAEVDSNPRARSARLRGWERAR